VPSAIRLQRVYGDDLAVLLVEVQRSSPSAIVKLQLGAQWLGTQAMWTSERPFRVPSKGRIPHFALLDPEGRVVLMGLNSGLHGKIVEEIERMVKERKKVPTDLSPAVAKAALKLRLGDFGAAYRATNKVLKSPPRNDAERVLKEANELRERTLSRAKSAVDRVQWFLENGYSDRAKDSIDAVTQAVKGMEEIQARCKQISLRLKSKEMSIELAAANKVAKLERSLFADPNGDFRKGFAKLNKAYSETKAGQRAAYWVQNLSDQAE
jgi:hypothetical protein